MRKRLIPIALLMATLCATASAQRIGMYPLETTDNTLALAVPTAVARSLETIDGTVFPAPSDLGIAVRQRPAFLETLDKVFALEALVTGKLEGAAGAYSIAYTIKRGTTSSSVQARGADFAALVRDSNAKLIAALSLRPNSTDTQQLASVERSLPAADVVVASAQPGVAASAPILERAGQNPWALVGRALVLVGAGKNNEAIALTQNAVRASPSDPFVQAANVVALVAARKNPETKAALDVAFKVNPVKPELHYLNGRYLLRVVTPPTQESVQKALDALQQALQYNPRYLEAAITAADILETYGNTDRAVSVLTNLVARMPDEVSLHSRILETLLVSDRDGATAYLREVIKTFPDVTDMVYALAAELFDTDAANKLVAEGEVLYPNSAPLAFARAYLLERIGNYTEAVAAYRQSLTRDSNFKRSGLALAATLSKLGRFDEAESAFKAASSNDPKVLARMYLQTGRIERARAVLARLPQTDFDAVYLTGIAAMREYRADEAARSFDAALKIRADNAQVRRTYTELPDVRRLGAPKLTGDALYQFRLGQGLLDAGNPLEALTAFNKAVKAAPTDIHALLYRAFALLRSAAPDEARDAFADVVKIAPNNVVLQTYLALAELGRGRFDLAEEAANRAIGLDKTYARAYCTLGSIFFQQYAMFGTSTDVPKARDGFNRCIAADANFRVLIESQLSALPK
ncbi:MAG: tetratricopeptide repeat protein [Deinococcales bacterium]